MADDAVVVEMYKGTVEAVPWKVSTFHLQAAEIICSKRLAGIVTLLFMQLLVGCIKGLQEKDYIKGLFTLSKRSGDINKTR